MRRVSWFVLFLSCTFGCRPGAVTEQTTEPHRVRLLYQHSLIGLDPHAQNDGVTGAVLSGLFQPLVEVLPGARVEPVLAESWTTPTPEVWRFRIREGVFFHSGREMTPEDVVFSLNRARRPGSKGLSNYLNGIESVGVAPDGWVEIRTRGPFPLLAARLGMVGIVPRDYDPATPVGTGPFRWVSGDARGPLLFRRWEKFWAEKPDVEEVEMLFSSGDLESWELIRDGKIDVVGKTSLDFLMEHPLDDFPGRWTVIRNPASTTTILGLNLRSRPLNDPRVRLAIDLSIDREELVEKALSEGQGKPAASLVPEEVFGASPTRSNYHSDLLRARQLIREAGVPRGTRLVISHARVSMPILETISARLQQLGFTVQLEDQPFDVFYRKLGEGQLQAFIFGWNFDLGDAADFLESMAHSPGTAQPLGQLNGSGFSDPLVDRWIESAATEISPEKRLRDLRSALATLKRERPYLPLFHTLRQALFKEPYEMERRPGSWLRPYEIRVNTRRDDR